jgi:flagellar protein FliS
MNKKALDGYGRSALESEINYASPHRIIQMLIDGAISKVAIARGCIVRNDIPGKSRHITWAIDIISGLRTSLDTEKGGEIAENLNSLYDYMGRRLLESNVSNDPEILDEVTSLLKEIKLGWDSIPAEFQ